MKTLPVTPSEPVISAEPVYGKASPPTPVNLDPSPWNEPLIDPEKWVDVMLPVTPSEPVISAEPVYGKASPPTPVNLDPSPWNEPLIDPEKWVDVILPVTPSEPVISAEPVTVKSLDTIVTSLPVLLKTAVPVVGL